MGLQIEDGKGSGSVAEVKNNKLLVSATTSSQEHYANHNQGKGYNVNFTATPTGPGDCFFYMKNQDTSIALSIEGIWIKNAADDYIEITLNGEGSPIGGSDVTPVNMNTSSGLKALGIFQEGSDITGISGGDVALRLFHENSARSIYSNMNMDIVLGSNGVLALYAGAGTTEISGTVVFNYHGTNN